MFERFFSALSIITSIIRMRALGYRVLGASGACDRVLTRKKPEGTPAHEQVLYTCLGSVAYYMIAIKNLAFLVC